MPLDRPLGQLLLRPDHVQVPAGARVEGERQAVVAAARDVPVAHVAQPVVHPLPHVRGHPLDRPVRVEQAPADALDVDEPVVGDAEDERRVAAPAVRVVVQVGARLDEETALGQVADDLVGRLDGREPVQPAVVVVEAAGLVDRGQHRQAERAAELEVLAAAARGDVDDARALLERHLVPGDDAMLDAGARRERVERAAVAQPHELGAGGAADEHVVGKPRGEHPLAVLAETVLALRIHGRGDVRRQRPRRRRPDDDRLALAVEEREADEQGRVALLLVDARLASARAARARCRSAGTIRSPGGRRRASRARRRSSGSARCTRCSCR